MSTRPTRNLSNRRRPAAALAALLALLAPSASRAVDHPELCLEGPAGELDSAADRSAGGEGSSRDGRGSAWSVLPYLAHLVRLSGNGLLDAERAAFIVEQGDGRVGCEIWPFDNGHRRATYRGVVPGGTVAIAHTHPIDLPVPSENDRREAVRLGMTLWVASPWSVYEVTPEGEVRVLIRNRRWITGAGEGAVCTTAGSEQGTRTATHARGAEPGSDRGGQDPYRLSDRLLGFER